MASLYEEFHPDYEYWLWVTSFVFRKQTTKKDANQIAGVYFFLCFVFDCKYTEQLYDIGDIRREEKNSTV